MATGIKVTGSRNKVNENEVRSDGVGIEVDGEENEVGRNKVNVSSETIEQIITTLNLPDSVPREHVQQAIEVVADIDAPTQAPQALEASGLKQWLHENGFNMAFWASTAISIASLIK